GGVYVVPQRRFRGVHIALDQGLNGLLKHGLTKLRIPLDARFDEFLEAAAQGHDALVFSIRSSSCCAPARLVPRPSEFRDGNVPALPFLRAAAQENDDGLAVLPEVHPISRPPIEL